MFLGLSGDETWKLSERLDSDWNGKVVREGLEKDGLALPDLAPCSAMLLEIGR